MYEKPHAAKRSWQRVAADMSCYAASAFKFLHINIEHLPIWHEGIARQAQPRISTRSSAVLAKSMCGSLEGVGTSRYVLSL